MFTWHCYSWTFDLLLIDFSNYVWRLISLYINKAKIEIWIFTCLRCWYWRILFFNSRLNIPYHKFLIFLSFINTFFKSNLKSNHSFYKTDLFNIHPVGYELIKQLFGIHLQKCEIQHFYNETFLLLHLNSVFFWTRYFRDIGCCMYKTSNSLIYIFVVNCQFFGFLSTLPEYTI